MIPTRQSFSTFLLHTEEKQYTRFYLSSLIAHRFT